MCPGRIRATCNKAHGNHSFSGPFQEDNATEAILRGERGHDLLSDTEYCLDDGDVADQRVLESRQSHTEACGYYDADQIEDYYANDKTDAGEVPWFIGYEWKGANEGVRLFDQKQNYDDGDKHRHEIKEPG